MGAAQSSCHRMLNVVRPSSPILHVRVCGLEDSGKSSVVNYIKYGKVVTFEKEKDDVEANWVLYNKTKLMLTISNINVHKNADGDDAPVCNALIFVIDGTAKDKFYKAKELMMKQLTEVEGKPELLIFMNKSDDEKFCDIVELNTFLDLASITDRHVCLIASSAVTGDGIREGMDWLCHKFDVRNGKFVSRRDPKSRVDYHRILVHNGRISGKSDKDHRLMHIGDGKSKNVNHLEEPDDHSKGRWMSLKKYRKGVEDKREEYGELYKTIESWAESKSAEERDINLQVEQGIKDVSPRESVQGEMTVEEVLQMIEEQYATDDLQEREWIKHRTKLTKKILKRLQTVNRVPKRFDLVKYCMDTLEKEEKCGYRYPIVGTPDEVYSDPNVYKSWGRTTIEAIQFNNATRTPLGPPIPESDNIEDLITSKRSDDIKRELENIRTSRITEILEDASPITGVLQEGNKEELEQSEETHKYPTANLGRWMRMDILDLHKRLDAGGNEEILRVLNRYNPWDEYMKLKRSRCVGDVTVNYRVSLTENIIVDAGCERTTQITGELMSEYLHYFLVLDEDLKLVDEFKNANFLHDILKYFSLLEFEDEFVEQEKKSTEFLDIYDRFFNYYFNLKKGFPKGGPDSEFPLTLDPDSDFKPKRVNVYCALIALLRSHDLICRYEFDIFTEQRFRAILNIIERSLQLELERMNLGILEIETNYKAFNDLCEIDGLFLSTLSATLGLWNITRGIENIIDLITVLTLKKLHSISGTHLVSILINLCNLTTLPESVLNRFLSKVVQYIDDKLKMDIVHNTLWMDYYTASKLINVLAKHTDVIYPEFINNYILLYYNDIGNQGSITRECLDKSQSPTGAPPTPSENAASLETTQDTKSGDCGMVSGNINLVDGSKQELYTGESASLGFTRDSTDYQHTEPSDEFPYDYLMPDMIEARPSYMRRHQEMYKAITSLIVCISACGLAEEYKDLIVNLGGRLNFNEFEFDSAAAIIILDSCNEFDDAQVEMVKKAKKNLMDLKYVMDGPAILNTIEVYLKGIESKRLRVDSFVIANLFKTFVLLKEPRPTDIIRAAQLAERAKPFLSSNQLQVIFDELLEVPSGYNFLTRLGLDAEQVNYPIRTLAIMLQHASRCNVFNLTVWRNVYELINIFKHTLDLIVTEIVVTLMDRVCNIIEVDRYVDDDLMFDLMSKSVDLGHVPMRLLRWFIYLNMYMIDVDDMDGLADELLTERLDYDVDFRGWKRPLTFDEHTENLQLPHNIIVPVEMVGSKVKSTNVTKHKIPQHHPEKKPMPDLVNTKAMDGEKLALLIKLVKEIVNKGHKFDTKDLNIITQIFKLNDVTNIEEILKEDKQG